MGMMRFFRQLFVLSFLVLLSMGAGCSESDNGSTEPDPDVVTPVDFLAFVKGVDLSYVNQIEDNGGVYYKDGVAADPYVLLKDKGANLVRLRLWHNPSWYQTIYGSEAVLYSGFDDVKKSIRRAKEAGMAVCLDFHYSDTWADPSRQDVPEAWEAITDIEVLEDSVYQYTFGVLNQLYLQGLLPQMVQIGNESNSGMMNTNVSAAFPKLNVYDGNWGNYGQVVNAAIKAVRDLDAISGQKTVVALHVADPKNLDWWFTAAINQGHINDFDVMGFSYYHIWHTEIAFEDLPDLVTSLAARFDKKLMILETAYPFTRDNNDSYGNIYYNQPALSQFPYSVDGQKAFLTSLHQNMSEAGALGVMYWEPAWISSTMSDLWGKGSAWENCALFDFSGEITTAADYLNETY